LLIWVTNPTPLTEPVVSYSVHITPQLELNLR